MPEEVFKPAIHATYFILQTFPPEYPRVCAINSMYINALGTVGHVTIGWYTRTLLVFFISTDTMPKPEEMKRWVDFTRFLKSRSPEKAFDFFTYSEMVLYVFMGNALEATTVVLGYFHISGMGQSSLNSTPQGNR